MLVEIEKFGDFVMTRLLFVAFGGGWRYMDYRRGKSLNRNSLSRIVRIGRRGRMLSVSEADASAAVNVMGTKYRETTVGRDVVEGTWVVFADQSRCQRYIDLGGIKVDGPEVSEVFFDSVIDVIVVEVSRGRSLYQTQMLKQIEIHNSWG